jgi:serine/threonine-protein kinase
MMSFLSRSAAALAGRYEIERELGHGGMATVYLASDVRHNRKVALKVLRPELAAVIGAERFLAEIKTTASLQHPHILALHDSGDADGTVFYVMPYVEGESLRDRLARDKQLPVEQALLIARQIANALAYAHRHGVVHRDIKPENIMLQDGQALVADFGIALAVSHTEGATRMTETGMSLGTPHYMSPEQAMGEREITPAADIYALGCVLYEMLTGDPPFTGSTAQAIVARTLTERPRSITAQRHTVPPHVEAAVFTALEKLPADRFASAESFIAALDNPALTLHTHASSTRIATRPDWRARVAIPALVVAAIATAGFLWSATRPAKVAPVSRYVMEDPPGLDEQAARGVAVSRDGSKLLYAGPQDPGTTQLWLKARDVEFGRPVSGTTFASSFTFSPDGESIAFITTDGIVKRIAVTGGAAITLADSAASARGITWLEDGSIIYATNLGKVTLQRVSASGGNPETIYEGVLPGWYPTALPGSKGVLFGVCGGCTTSGDLAVLDLRTKQVTTIVKGAVMGRYVPTGHVLYVRADGGMLAVPFDASSLEATGDPVTVRDSVALGANRLPIFDVADDGTFFMRQGGSIAPVGTYDLVWIDRSGVETPVDTTFTFKMVVFGNNAGWSLSPDGSRVAIGRNTDAGDNVWVKQLPNGPLSRVTFDSTSTFRPRWSRDGKFIIYIARINIGAVLMRKRADGTGVEELIANHGGAGVYEAAFTADEKSIVLRTGGTINQVGGRDISIRTVDDTTLKPLVATAFDESGIAISPDGRWLAYESNETGQTEVIIRPFPDVDGGKWQVSLDGGRAPLWSRDGRELFFVNSNRELMSVNVGSGASPNNGTPRRLFKLRPELYLAAQENYTPYDVAPNGRFLMARRLRLTAARVPPLVVTENWLAELRDRVGVR